MCGTSAISGVLDSTGDRGAVRLDAGLGEITASSYTLVLSDRDKLLKMNSASPQTLTVPPSSSVAFPVGSELRIGQYGVGQVTVSPGSGVTIRATPGLKTRAQYSIATCRKIAADEWVVSGDLSA